MAEVRERKGNDIPVKFIAVFIILAMGMIAAGFFSHRQYGKHYLTEVERELSAIAHLKVSELARWRGERLGDGEIIYRNADLSDQVARYLRNPRDREAERKTLDWLRQYPEHHEYDQVRLLDPRGATRMSIPPGRPPASAAVTDRIPEILQSGRVTIIDFYRNDYDQRVYLSVVIPILDASAGNRAIGAVSLRVDPEKYPFPFIKRWLTPSRTAETMLVRREGNDVILLNDLNTEKGSALRLRVPLDKRDVPEVKAVSGFTGIVEGLDLRGVRVIADVRSVPDSPWFLVTRMDSSEVLGPEREHMWMVIGLVTALVFATGAGLAFVRRRQNFVFYRERYKAAEALRESEARYRALFEQSAAPIWLADAATGSFEDFNTAGHEYLGYTREEFARLNIADTEAAETAEEVARHISRIIEKGTDTFETVQRAKNGELRNVLVSAAYITIGGRKFIQSVARDFSDRKRAEEELRRNQAMLAHAESIAHVGSWELDLVNSRLHWSDEVYRIFGFQPREFAATYEAFIEAVHPDDRAAVDAAYTGSVREGRDTYEIEHRVVRKSTGEVRIVHEKCFHVRDGSGRIVRSTGMAHDITERKQAVEKLHSSELWLRSIYNSLDEAVFVVTPDRRVVNVNRATEGMFGYSEEELRSRNTEILHVDHGHYVEFGRRIQEAFAGNRVADFAFEMKRKNGEIFPTEHTVTLLKDKEGVIAGIVSVVRDISERRRREEEFKKVSRQNELILESAGEGIYGLDLQGNVTFVNTVAAQMVGFTREDILGTDSHFAWHHKKPDGSRHAPEECPIYAAYSEGIIHSGETTFWRKDGTGFPVDFTSRPIIEEGKIRGAVVTYRDITERKRAEEELRHKQAMLTHAEGIAHVGSWELDLINNRLHWSDEAYRIFGFQPQEVSATYETFLEVVHPEDRAAVDAAYTGSVREGRDGYEIEHRVVRKSTGEIRIVHEKCFHFRDESGRIVRSTGMTHDITERKSLEQTITQMAQHDALTGLPNRRLFREIIDHELAEARRNRRKVALLFVDLDRFKQINDTFGHETGDELLREVSKRLKASIRESDAAARIGGDEFNIILADISRTQDITLISVKILESFDKLFMIAGHEIRMTASIGISVYPDDSDQIDTLCRYADIAMYHAKETGRNSFQFYNSAINTRSLERMRMESMLRQSIARNELTVYYQPQINISSRKIVSAEALVRWNHPERGLLEPGQFISTAEDAGFITVIDEYVLKTACARIRSWLNAALPAVHITVNLSAREFQNPELIGTLTHILENACAPPGYLDIEITESLAMSNMDRTIARLSELAKMGVHAYIDDFGAGYSSLNVLKKLPVKKLKIDRSFIKEISTSAGDREIIIALTAIAHTMRMSVIAEGVETEEQLAFLRSTRCDEAQGYLFSKALPAEEFDELLSRSR